MPSARVPLACVAGLVIVVFSHAAFGATLPGAVGTDAGTSEDPGRGHTPSSQAFGSFAIEAFSTDPVNPGTNSFARIDKINSDDPVLHATAAAVANEFSIEGSLDNIASARALWTDSLSLSPFNPPVPTAKVQYLETVMALTGQLKGWSEVFVVINNAGSLRINRVLNVDENEGLEVRVITVPPAPIEQSTRLELTSRSPIPVGSTQVTLSLLLEVAARANSRFVESLSDFSGNSLDLISLAIVDENNVLVPGATITSQNGFQYTVLNSVPEPSSAILLAGAFLTLLGRRRVC